MTRALLLLTLFTGAWSASSAISQHAGLAVSRGDDKVAGLQDRLEKGLKARRPVEFAYIAKVVSAVEAGHLPVDVVDRIFFWARQEKPDRPFQHFEAALTKQAKLFGVKL